MPRIKVSIVIWGAGNQGIDAYYFLKKYFIVEGFLDSDSKKQNMMVTDGKIVLESNLNKSLIVIACNQWINVSWKLMENGLTLITDFIPFHMMKMQNINLNDMFECFDIDSIIRYLNKSRSMKKIALIYGNCQVDIMANMLEYNKDFAVQYLLIRVPPIHLYTSSVQIENLLYTDRIMKLIDLFIFQNVSENNRFNKKLATSSILGMLSDKCRRVAIHNIYFDGYFIQYDSSEEKYLNNMYELNFPYSDRIVDFLVREEKSVEEILERINDIQLIDQEQIWTYCARSLNNLREREKQVDIPILDYIENHYCEQQLFYTHNHPKNIVIFEYVKRILKYIGISNVDSNLTEEEMNMEFGTLRVNNFPIFPCVIKTLGLKKYEYKMKISYISQKLVTMNEYIKEYISRCYGNHD